ncbi:hypothetical protein ACQXZJ_11420 [Corynebacterium diphtheriae]
MKLLLDQSLTHKTPDTLTAIARQLTDNEEQQKFSQTVQELLQQFGVEKLSQLPADKLTEFITAVKERV